MVGLGICNATLPIVLYSELVMIAKSAVTLVGVQLTHAPPCNEYWDLCSVLTDRPRREFRTKPVALEPASP